MHRIGWLRAAVLGANDGIVSTASLIIGVASASASKDSVLLAGVAGLAGVPILAIMFAVAGLLLLDGLLVAALLRLIFRRKRE